MNTYLVLVNNEEKLVALPKDIKKEVAKALLIAQYPQAESVVVFN